MADDGVEAAILAEEAFADSGALPSWSASGRWLAYYARRSPESAERHLWVRRHDAGNPTAGWREPVLASAGQWRALGYGGITPSPTRDQFLLGKNDGGAQAIIAVVTPHEDGTVDVHELHHLTNGDDLVPTGQVLGAWTPDGARVVLIIKEKDVSDRLVVHDIHPSGNAPPSSARDLLAPAGTSFGLPWLMLRERLSADGRWISLDMQRDAGGQPGLAAVPLDGGGAAREVPGCAVGRESGAPSCAAGEWHPTRSMQIVRRGPIDALEIVVWDPDAGVLATVPAFEGHWLGHSARMLVRPDRTSRRLGVVDVDVDAPTPAITFVDGTDLPSFLRASASPDGRWLLLEHYDRKATWLEIVDLDAAPPWARREVVRTPFGQPRFNFEHWSPPGGTTLLLASRDLPRGDERAVDRAISVDLPTAKAIAIEVRHAAPADGARQPVWSWANRSAPAGDSIVLARDGQLAVWRVGAPLTELVTLPDTSEWATVVWRPALPSP